jgi:pimeloyl-ACP methyl ester carboxylesterase
MQPFTVASGKAQVWVETEGGGEPVVFLHAGIADRRMWQEQVTALAPHFRAVAYDRRGFGRTVHADEPYAHVSDLLAVLDEVAPSRPAILVGCSQGGRVSIDAALAVPNRVRALVLVAPAITGAPEPAHFPPAVQTVVDAMDAADAAGDLDRLNEAEAHAWLDGPAQPRGRVGGAPRALFLEMNRAALRAERRGEERAPRPAYDRVARIGVPALVVWGNLDFPHVLANCTYLGRTLQRARTLEMKGVAHLPNLEQPERFNAAVLDFCCALPA